jgi:hypothetical protein
VASSSVTPPENARAAASAVKGMIASGDSVRSGRSSTRGLKRPLVVFGRAPFAFYVAHLYLIHTLAVAFGVFQGFDARAFLTYSFFFPDGYGVALPGVYAVWVLVVLMLYPLCRWVAAVKARRQDWWLSYL